MITIDIPLPKSCEDCPCSHWVLHGDYEGELMCQAMEAASPKNETGECIVNADSIPKKCPMMNVILPVKCPYCGKKIGGRNDN